MKIAFSAILLYIVFQKIPFNTIWLIIKKANYGYLLLALIALLVSQIISSSRLLLFLNSLHFNLAYKSNLKLYFIGMFYNFFIPGGIGGDAYKIYLLNNKFKWKVKSLTSAIFFDRLNGLIAIFIWILILLFPIDSIQKLKFHFAIPILIIGGFFLSKFITQKLTKSFDSIFNKALLYSMSIQGLQIICVFFILKSLNYQEHTLEYLILFLLSVILSVISFSGIGVREFLFLKAAEVLNYNAEVSIALGAVFTLITIIVSASGIFFQFSKNTIYLTTQIQE